MRFDFGLLGGAGALVALGDLWRQAFGVVRHLGDHRFAWRLFPLAVVVDVAVHAGGADDGRRSDADAIGVLEDGLECDAEIAAAENVEAESLDVAVERFVIVELIFADDGVRADPVDEIVFDGVAIGMIANRTFAGVAFGIGRGVGIDRSEFGGSGFGWQNGIGRSGNGSWLDRASPFAHCCTPQAVGICTEPVTAGLLLWCVAAGGSEGFR